MQSNLQMRLIKATDSTEAPSTSCFQAPAMTDDEATQLSAHLVSQDMATYRTVFAVEDGQNVPALTPVGTKIDIDLNTFYSMDTAGRVDSVITLSGKSPENWRILLLYIDGQWRVHTMESM